MTFEEWIDQVTIRGVAHKLNLHEMTVTNWRSGRNDPKVDHMRRIKRLTKGVIGYDQMIDRKVLTSRVPQNKG